MIRLKKRNTRAAMLLATVAAAGVLAAAAYATLPVGFTVTILGSGDTDHAVALSNDGIRLNSNGPVNVTTGEFVLAPGGKTGWHSHPGIVTVIVQSGTTKLTHVEDGKCVNHVYTAGDVFTEMGRTHIARNLGDTEVSLLATFVVPRGTPSLRIDEPVPACAKG